MRAILRLAWIDATATSNTAIATQRLDSLPLLFITRDIQPKPTGPIETPVHHRSSSIGISAAVNLQLSRHPLAPQIHNVLTMDRRSGEHGERFDVVPGLVSCISPPCSVR